MLLRFWGKDGDSYVHTPSLFAWLHFLYTVGGENNDTAYGELILMWSSACSGGNERNCSPCRCNSGGRGCCCWRRRWRASFGFLVQQPIFSIVRGLFRGIYALARLAATAYIAADTFVARIA